MTVAFDQLTLGNSDGLAVTTLTINSTSVGSNRLAIIFVTTGGGNLAGLAVTVGGVAATQLAAITSQIETWYFIAPPTGSTAYLATTTNLIRMVNYVVTFNGVRQASPIRQELSNGSATSTTSSLTFTSSIANDMLVDCVHHYINEDEVPGVGQTERSAEQFFANNNFRQSVSTKPVAGASEVASWTWATAVDREHKGVCLVDATAAGNQVHWFFSRMRDFSRDLRTGLVPPDGLRRRYGDLVTI